jgi:hypothetical protein
VKAVGRDELGGDAVQPGTTSSLYPCGDRSRSNVARVRRATQNWRPTQFVSAGACVCKAIDHAHAG